jgi:imidazoleglycerol-phosphate dehydratase / histidinol-phosphatase
VENKPKKLLFIDRDGTIIKEAPPLYRVDEWEKLEFYPHVFRYLGQIARELNYQLIMVTNQDGLGTDIFPDAKFWPIHNHIMRTFLNEGICFTAVHIDPSFPFENKATRKPQTGMLTKYLRDPQYDIQGSYVIGDRITDVQLAKNLHCKAIWLKVNPTLGIKEVQDDISELKKVTALETTEWRDIYEFLKKNEDR